MQTKRKLKDVLRESWLPLLLALALALGGLIVLGYALRRSVEQGRPAEADDAAAAVETVYDLDSFAAAHGLTRADYPDALIELYDKNPEARQFVLEYPLRAGEEAAIDLSAEAASGTVPLLLQWDERWGYRIYNNSFMARTGCGPTCLSMAVIALTGDGSFDPWTLAQYAEQNGYSVPGSGTEWRFIPDGAAYCGLHAQQLGLSQSVIEGELTAGRLVICVVGPGDFTDNGHFLLLTGVENGLIRLNDPNSPRNSNQLWTYDRLAGQIRSLWSIGP